jgi:hypothetical protein
MFLRVLIFVHRWLGVALCLLFLLWFPSGIVLMYWPFPSVDESHRLARAPALDPKMIALTPQEAADRIGVNPSPSQVRLNMFDGRPVYRFAAGRSERVVFADTGEERVKVSEFTRRRAAEAWTGLSASDATIESVGEVDQWTVGAPLRTMRPLWKFEWPNGEHVYVNESATVVQHTTRGSRLGAYLGAIPHWVYFTPLRKNQPVWIKFMIWSSGIGTISALIGIVVGVWMYSPSKRYRHEGAPSSLPYNGQKRWHAILGLVFGVATVTWAFSGMLSLDPFPQSNPVRPSGPAGPGVAALIRGTVHLTDFAAAHPRDVLARHASLQVKELELTSFAGRPLYGASLADGTTRMLSLDGQLLDDLGRDQIVEVVRKAAPDPTAVEATTLQQYDRYYLDRTRRRPLPVLLFKMHDEERTRYYIDPTTASIVGRYSSRNWMDRWLYNGLHSLNFPWLYNYRPLWDIVVITFMVGGTALCITSLVLAWRVLGRRIERLGLRPSRPA